MKAMIRAYPDKTTAEESVAVKSAIEETEKLIDGADRMKVINFVYFQKHTKPDKKDLEYAALAANVSYETAKRWHRNFVNCVADGFKCNGLPKY